LTVVHVQLEAAQALLASAPDRALAALAKAQHLTHEGLNEVRRSVSLLRGSAPARPPLVEALTALAAECSAAGLAADLRLEGSPRRLAEPVEFTLYRAAQEALTNARRHACASRIDLRLEFAAGERVRLCVQDDGAGACEPPRAGGFGLLGLRERAELVGGRVSIRTAPAQGFALELEVPG
jgi:signal transduction histidine kinase